VQAEGGGELLLILSRLVHFLHVYVLADSGHEEEVSVEKSRDVVLPSSLDGRVGRGSAKARQLATSPGRAQEIVASEEEIPEAQTSPQPIRRVASPAPPEAESWSVACRSERCANVSVAGFY
jgi:hypothetical protein